MHLCSVEKDTAFLSIGDQALHCHRPVNVEFLL